MRFRSAAIALVLLLIAPAAQARVTKAECKAHTASIKELAERLGVSDEVKGRELMSTVETWIEGADEATIMQTIDEIATATAGIRSCETGGFYNFVQRAKATSKKLESALPWLKHVTAAEPCQALISKAVRERSAGNLDTAIADLERSAAECKDESWLPEAHGNLADAYLERGSVESNDYANAHEQVRKALPYGEAWGEEDLNTLRAILAKPMIEAGAALMEQRAYDVARSHWQAYIDIFGTPSFDVLFDVPAISQGSRPLRELLDARYQLALACLESRDVACATATVRSAAEEYKTDSTPIRELTSRALDLASNAESIEQDEAYRLALDLLNAWHELDPDSYQIKTMVEDTFVPCEPEQRMRILRLTEACWLPTQVAECLKQEGEDYFAEATLAASCDSTGGQAQQLLADLHFQTACNKLDRIVLAESTGAKHAVLKEVENEILPKITDPSSADKVRERISEERTRIRNASVQAVQNKDERYAACTELLALIQWNQARENEYEGDLRDFRRGCCGFLKKNESGWMGWMRARPESVRLAETEIVKKQKLMGQYCRAWSN